MPVPAAYAFRHQVDAIAGSYLDSVQALPRYSAFIASSHAALPTAPGQDTTNDSVAYFGIDEQGNRFLVHHAPVTHVRSRNATGGENLIALGNQALVTIFAYWEHRFRADIAAQLGMSSDQLTVPIMGDLRLLRNAILHNGGIADPPCSRLEVIDWITVGMPIRCDEIQFLNVLASILHFVDTSDALRGDTA